jgi:hypothetical protein
LAENKNPQPVGNFFLARGMQTYQAVKQTILFIGNFDFGNAENILFLCVTKL